MKISRSEVDVFCSVARKKEKPEFPALRFWWCAKYAGDAADKERNVRQITRLTPLRLREPSRRSSALLRGGFFFVCLFFNYQMVGFLKKIQRRLKTYQLQQKAAVCRRKSNAQLEVTPLKVRAQRTEEHLGSPAELSSDPSAAGGTRAASSSLTPHLLRDASPVLLTWDQMTLREKNQKSQNSSPPQKKSPREITEMT